MNGRYRVPCFQINHRNCLYLHMPEFLKRKMRTGAALPTVEGVPVQEERGLILLPHDLN